MAALMSPTPVPRREARRTGGAGRGSARTVVRGRELWTALRWAGPGGAGSGRCFAGPALQQTMAQLLGSIGTIKCQKYGFNRPAARSVAMMGVCGQRAALGFNLSKLVRCIARKQRMTLDG